MAADIFSHHHDLAGGIRETRGVGGAGGGIEWLPRL
jgi:hypothetical protein